MIERLARRGLYVAVSRAKQKLSLYTADKEQLFKHAQRSSAKENPSDYLTLFNLVNPDAQNPKAADPARDVRGADQSEYIGDLAGECVAVGHQAAVRRDSAAQGRSKSAKSRTSGLTPEYVSDVRSVVSGIAERRRTAELEGQAERIREAAEGIISGARQLEQTATAVNRLHEQLEQQAGRLSRTSEQAAEQERKRRRRRQIYQQYAAKFVGKSDRECDHLVVRQLMSELLAERSGKRLSDNEIVKVGSILLQGPVAQELKQTQGKEAGVEYAMEVLAKERKVVEKAQRRSRDQGMEI